MKGRKSYIIMLKGKDCQCGKKKSPKVPFCHNCYYKLPDLLRSNLYGSRMSGREAGYSAAVGYLNK